MAIWLNASKANATHNILHEGILHGNYQLGMASAYI